MSTYKVSVSNNKIKVDATNTKHETKVTTLDYSASLSRVGGQGSKGDSVTNAVIDSNSDLIITVTKADGTTEEVNAGNLETVVDVTLGDDFELSSLTEGDVLIYNGTDAKWNNHQLTTSKVLDIDNTNKAEGAVLVYDAATAKYISTTRIENAETLIIGGLF